MHAAVTVDEDDLEQPALAGGRYKPQSWGVAAVLLPGIHEELTAPVLKALLDLPAADAMLVLELFQRRLRYTQVVHDVHRIEPIILDRCIYILSDREEGIVKNVSRRVIKGAALERIQAHLSNDRLPPCGLQAIALDSLCGFLLQPRIRLWLAGENARGIGSCCFDDSEKQYAQFERGTDKKKPA
jgi:hypothetical protein